MCLQKIVDKFRNRSYFENLNLRFINPIKIFETKSLIMEGIENIC